MSKQVRLTLPDDLYQHLKEQDHSQLHITFIKKPIYFQPGVRDVPKS